MLSTLSPVVDKISFEQYRIVDLTERPASFLEMLPEDWTEELMPSWSPSKGEIRVIAIEENGNLIGGGLVFKAYTSENDSYPELAKSYFDKAYFYLGYIWIDPTQRGKNLGSFWLKEVMNLYPQNSFWLTIVDPALGAFYERNGFLLVSELELETGKEWVYVKEN